MQENEQLRASMYEMAEEIRTTRDLMSRGAMQQPHQQFVGYV